MKIGFLMPVVGLGLFFQAAGALSQEPEAGVTGPLSWQTQAHGVTVSLTQIMPDQARAFYVNRGFPLEAIEAFATSCVFMTVLRNDSAPGSVHFRLSDWAVVRDDNSQAPLSVEHWQDALQPYGLTRPALVAFRWAQFPSEQTYHPGGDWNQGMLTTGLSAGTEFTLQVRWDIDGKPYQGELKNVRCAQ